jgi:hypothetical protein
MEYNCKGEDIKNMRIIKIPLHNDPNSIKKIPLLVLSSMLPETIEKSANVPVMREKNVPITSESKFLRSTRYSRMYPKPAKENEAKKVKIKRR